MNADGTSRQQVFYEKGSAAMGPQWSQDGNSIVFGLGGGFQTRNTPARIMMMRPDGSDVRTLTTGPGAGFPSLSPDGKRLVFRVWGPGADDRGLRILTLETGAIARLTGSEYDTFPGWSPKGDVIAFSSWRNGDYDIYTIRPDGTGLKQLTTAKGNDAHSSWSPDGEFLMFSSSRFGFKDEAALFDGQPQPYGEIFIMKADGSDQRPLTDNQWEDGPGAWEPMAKQSSSTSARPTGAVTSLYDLKTDTLLGKPAELASYRGRVTLVVNVASECGFTPQYEGLEKLHRELSGKGFAVLGFPSNDFGGQEPGTAQEIASFCRLNYGVTFPMFAKLSTVPGPQQSPIYKFLGASGHLPAWNFSKYVVGKDGTVVAFFPSKVTPDAPELRSAIAKALAQ
jgi:glutathione peroxidase-family protein